MGEIVKLPADQNLWQDLLNIHFGKEEIKRRKGQSLAGVFSLPVERCGSNHKAHSMVLTMAGCGSQRGKMGFFLKELLVLRKEKLNLVDHLRRG